MSRRSHSPWVGQCSHIWRGVQIMELHCAVLSILLLLPVPCARRLERPVPVCFLVCDIMQLFELRYMKPINILLKYCLHWKIVI